MNQYFRIAKAPKPIAESKSKVESSASEVNTDTKPKTQKKPVFCSSFIQYWFAQDFDYNRWYNELKMLKDIGINEIILQDIADTKGKYAAYPTKIPGYKCNDKDMVGTALSAADSLNMKVRVGLGFSNKWWIMNAFCRAWLELEAKDNRAIVRELIEMYSTHSSFSGWYIPYEIHQLAAITKTQQATLNDFLKQITKEIKQHSTKDIMIAPFYNGTFSFLISIPKWSRQLENILSGAGIDILALQDSIGAGFNKMKAMDSLFYYTKKATDKLGIKLYADTETFTAQKPDRVPAPTERIIEQLNIQNKYVEAFVAFSINHYQNRNVPSQVKNYNDYYNYYLDNKRS